MASSGPNIHGDDKINNGEYETALAESRIPLNNVLCKSGASKEDEPEIKSLDRMRDFFSDGSAEIMPKKGLDMLFKAMSIALEIHIEESFPKDIIHNFKNASASIEEKVNDFHKQGKDYSLKKDTQTGDIDFTWNGMWTGGRFLRVQVSSKDDSGTMSWSSGTGAPSRFLRIEDCLDDCLSPEDIIDPSNPVDIWNASLESPVDDIKFDFDVDDINYDIYDSITIFKIPDVGIGYRVGNEDLPSDALYLCKIIISKEDNTRIYGDYHYIYAGEIVQFFRNQWVLNNNTKIGDLELPDGEKFGYYLLGSEA